VLIALFVANISFGPVTVPFRDVINSLFGGTVSRNTYEYIILNYRLPKALTAILAGVGLSVSGLLMQTLFRNPLAGPDVLGLSSGSGLGVATIILGAGLIPGTAGSLLLSPYTIILASCAGSFLVLLAVLFVSQRLRNTMAILIVGLMFGSFASAIVGVLTFYSTAEQLQKFSFWALGNLGNLTWDSVAILTSCVVAGLLMSLISVKSLNGLLLGENYAKSIGINFNKSRLIIIIATSILAGGITAFTGPIAFVGLAVPHLAKLTFRTSSHLSLLTGTVFLGAITMLICDMLSQPFGTDITLPINAITSLIGAPVVVWLLVRRFKTIA
jgi:iron complex transport system permease protein